MNSIFFFPGLAVFLLMVMGIYFVINPSYEKSIEAQYYYETADYNEAYKLANEAFSLDVYNRMASTIMAQSKTAMKYKKYIDQAKQYMAEINAIAQKDAVSDGDRARIKLMSEIMVESYKKLAPSVVTDRKLISESIKYYKDFEKLLEKVNR